MNEYKIYHVKREHMRDYGFRSLEAIRKSFPDQPGLPREAWEPVYVYFPQDLPNLETIYLRFQQDFGVAPADYTGHSMSVSDIVETPDGKFWFCDSMGWREVQWAEEARE